VDHQIGRVLETLDQSRYADGSQELYEIAKDPGEWHNLAGDARYASVIETHAAHLPQVNAEALPGSRGLGSALADVPD
jgi:hypothetical protein